MLSWGNARSGKSGRHVIDIRARIIKLQFRRQPLADITYETQYCSQASGFNFGHPGFCILFPFFTSRVLAFSACPIRRNEESFKLVHTPTTTPIPFLVFQMEAIFDNKANVLNAQLHASHDNSVIYDISTSQTLWRRTYTYLRDTNPVSGGESIIVGAINWKKKTFEIQGQRKAIKDIRRKPKGFFKK